MQRSLGSDLDQGPSEGCFSRGQQGSVPIENLEVGGNLYWDQYKHCIQRKDVFRGKNLERELAGSYRYANHSMQFISTYVKGLTGAEAAWASQKCHGHHTLPPHIAVKNSLKAQIYPTSILYNFDHMFSHMQHSAVN